MVLLLIVSVVVLVGTRLIFFTEKSVRFVKRLVIPLCMSRRRMSPRRKRSLGPSGTVFGCLKLNSRIRNTLLLLCMTLLCLTGFRFSRVPVAVLLAVGSGCIRLRWMTCRIGIVVRPMMMVRRVIVPCVQKMVRRIQSRAFRRGKRVVRIRLIAVSVGVRRMQVKVTLVPGKPPCPMPLLKCKGDAVLVTSLYPEPTEGGALRG